MAKLLSVISSVFIIWSGLAIRPGEIFGTVAKVGLVAIIVFAGSVYKDWLDEVRAEKRRKH